MKKYSLSLSLSLSLVIPLLLLFAFSPAKAFAAVTFVQGTAGGSSFGGTTSTGSFGSNVTAGDTIIVLLQWIDNGAGSASTVSSLTDNEGDTFHLIPSSLATHAGPDVPNVSTELAYATGANGGATTVSASLTGPGSTALFVGVIETTPSAFDTASKATGISINPSAGSVTTTGNGEFAAAEALTDDNIGAGSGFNAGSGWTSFQDTGGGAADEASEYQAQASAGSITGNFSDSHSGTWVASMALFKTPPPPAPPVISSVATSTTDITATITWTTDESSTSTVNYGASTSYGSASSSASLVTSHSITLTGLTPSTPYHFDVASGNNIDGASASSDYTFTTASLITNIYVANTSVGADNGTDCANAYPASWFNNSSDWGTTNGDIGPGVTVHLCGTITTNLAVQGSGTSGHPITIYFEPNAKISLPDATPMTINNQNYIIVDGGTDGIIENTANGTELADHVADSGIYAPSTGNLEVKNLTIQNLYVHTSDASGLADSSIDFTVGAAVYLNGAGSNISIHNNTFHDMGWVIFPTQGSGDSGLNIYDNDLYNYDHGVGGVGGAMASPANVNIYNNHFGSTANWDTTANAYHHDGIHIYFGSGGLISGVNIYNNLFDGNWGSNNTAYIFLEGDDTHTNPNAQSNFTFYNNVFDNYSGNYINDGFIAGGGPNWSFYNNTFIGSGVTNSTCATISGTGLIFKNNIVSGCTTFLSPGSGTDSFAAGGLDYNLYANSTPGGNSPWDYNGTSINSFSVWQSATGQEAHSSYVASAALNSSGQLLVNSPAITAAANLTSLSIPALDLDIASTARPGSGAWDIGAYEHSVTSYTLTYTAGANGSLSGTASQTISSGGNGTAITAVPNSGYQFSSWSDSSTANPRTDTNVLANITVTANFTAITSSGGGGGGSSSALPVHFYGGSSGTSYTSVSSSVSSVNTTTAPTLSPQSKAAAATILSSGGNLSLGESGTSVYFLQRYLNAEGFTIATTGTGSPGHESTYFGSLTLNALKAFQSSLSLPSTGYFGPMTRRAIAKKQV